jgi:hypothetical protein
VLLLHPRSARRAFLMSITWVTDAEFQNPHVIRQLRACRFLTGLQHGKQNVEALSRTTCNSNASTLALLPAHSLVIGVGCSHYQLFGAGVKNGLLNVVGTIRQAGHLNMQSHRVFRFSHVRVDV